MLASPFRSNAECGGARDWNPACRFAPPQLRLNSGFFPREGSRRSLSCLGR